MAQDSIPSNLAAVNAPAQTAQPTIYADAQENQAPVKDEVVDQPVVDSTLPARKPISRKKIPIKASLTSWRLMLIQKVCLMEKVKSHGKMVISTKVS